MNILVACEESQEVCKRFREKGHVAFSCDIQECSGGHPEWHILGDVTGLVDGCCEFQTQDGVHHEIGSKWDMIIAFPPCTYLSNAGACRLYPKKGDIDIQRLLKGYEAKEFFMMFYNADCQKVAIENPVSSRIYQMPKHTQEIQPYEYDVFGSHPYTKRTRLRLRGLSPLVPTTPDRTPKGNYVPAGTSRKDRSKYGAAKRGEDAKNRSKTFSGIAQAMADQWG